MPLLENSSQQHDLILINIQSHLMHQKKKLLSLDVELLTQAKRISHTPKGFLLMIHRIKR
jgi:hypothetical protein